MKHFIEELDSLMGQARWDEAEALLLLYKSRAQARGDRQTELFRALGSFLPDRRREKLMKALQIARLSRLAQSALAQSDREE